MTQPASLLEMGLNFPSNDRKTGHTRSYQAGIIQNVFKFSMGAQLSHWGTDAQP